MTKPVYVLTVPDNGPFPSTPIWAGTSRVRARQVLAEAYARTNVVYYPNAWAVTGWAKDSITEQLLAEAGVERTT